MGRFRPGSGWYYICNFDFGLKCSWEWLLSLFPAEKQPEKTQVTTSNPIGNQASPQKSAENFPRLPLNHVSRFKPHLVGPKKPWNRPGPRPSSICTNSGDVWMALQLMWLHFGLKCSWVVVLGGGGEGEACWEA